MPLLTLHLLRLTPTKTVPAFIQDLHSTPNTTLILASEPRHLVIKPTHLDVSPLTTTQWDLLVLLHSPSSALPEPLQSSITSEYKLTVGIPTKLVSRYPDHNAKLIADAPDVKLTGALAEAQEMIKDDAQNLELSPELLAFMDQLTKTYGDTPVTMLNLLQFNEGGKEGYYKYGQAFVEVAGRRGGDAKLVGNVVSPPEGTSDSRGDATRPAGEWWNEISIVHYPSIKAFCDMLAGKDYQEINAKYRQKALKDTLLLCTTEIGLDTARRNAKL